MGILRKNLDILLSKPFSYTIYRALDLFLKRTNLIQIRFPVNPLPFKGGNEVQWRSSFCDRHFICSVKEKDIQGDAKGNNYSLSRILEGDCLFFNKEWKSLGLDYDWVTNPDSGYRYDVSTHWSKISTLSEKAGDIKYVWEKSRFSWLNTIVRHDYHSKEDHSEFVIGQILDWIHHNPINCGPNYVCSQEISLRLLNWVMALTYYRESIHLNDSSWGEIINSIYWQSRHVYSNINYSRYTVRNNHAITETLTLYLMGLLFPQMPGARKWKKKGKRWFEKEIDYQIEEDGTFIQDSMNYHRVVIQLLSVAISLAERNGETFSDAVYQKAWRALDFLYQCQDSESGWLPNYGSNDGALFFPLSDADYRDYRPQLDALHVLLTGKSLYDGFMEDTMWLTSGFVMKHSPLPAIRKKEGIVRFEKSGFYLIREGNCLTFMRCGNFKKQGTTDQLHLDIWKDGQNYLIDGGSYKYNTDPESKRYFSGTESHNTVMLGDNDQMLKGPRFMWFYPTERISFSAVETEGEYVFEGAVRCFRYLDNGIVVKRKVRKIKGWADWYVEDTVVGKPAGMKMRQLWHWLPSVQVNVESDASVCNGVGRYSSYYGIEVPSVQCECVTDNTTISTHISI